MAFSGLSVTSVVVFEAAVCWALRATVNIWVKSVLFCGSILAEEFLTSREEYEQEAKKRTAETATQSWDDMEKVNEWQRYEEFSRGGATKKQERTNQNISLTKHIPRTPVRSKLYSYWRVCMRIYADDCVLFQNICFHVVKSSWYSINTLFAKFNVHVYKEEVINHVRVPLLFKN